MENSFKKKVKPDSTFSSACQQVSNQPILLDFSFNENVVMSNSSWYPCDSLPLTYNSDFSNNTDNLLNYQDPQYCFDSHFNYTTDFSNQESVPNLTFQSLETHVSQIKPRPEKSLCSLCEKFLELYSWKPCSNIICIDDLAKELGIERRRIYDLLNIFSGLHLLEKKGKNYCSWLGLENLNYTLHYVQETFISKSKENYWAFNHEKDRSLEFVAQKFLSLLLFKNGNPITLNEAVEIFQHEEKNNKGKGSTLIRRLYDISNVLCTIGLIEKTRVIKDNRSRCKTAYKFLGFEGCRLRYYTTKEEATVISNKDKCVGVYENKMKRESLVDITNNPNVNRVIEEEKLSNYEKFSNELTELLIKYPNERNLIQVPGYIEHIIKKMSSLEKNS